MITTTTQELLDNIAREFAALPQVRAVALAGSQGGGHADARSDIDLCVYADPEPSETWRAALAKKFGEHISIGNRFWEPGDEWVAGNVTIDIMYRSSSWIEDQLDRSLLRHQASVGYSTCFVFNVLHSTPLYDRDGWYTALQAMTSQPYPEPLRRAIVAKNHPILRNTLSSYTHQITLALEREDHVSINHRISALLASYFDILFAVNRLHHPGEKRLVAHVTKNCALHPPGFSNQIHELLLAAAPDGRSDLIGKVNELLDGLDTLLKAEALIAL